MAWSLLVHVDVLRIFPLTRMETVRLLGFTVFLAKERRTKVLRTISLSFFIFYDRDDVKIENVRSTQNTAVYFIIGIESTYIIVIRLYVSKTCRTFQQVLIRATFFVIFHSSSILFVSFCLII